ncbi:MAG: cytochrome d ubiquinol oxidase subunit II [Sumerlaeia bacterium]
MLEMIDLNIIWYLLLGFLICGYAVLDGFDLGVGVLHLFAKGDVERRAMMHSIGPVWDGNEVWLVVAGGSLFAMFPNAYATAFSGFYIPFVALLFMLIFRAVSLEFRDKETMPWWRKMWDFGFFLSSTVAALLFGVAIGDLVMGLPIGADMEYQGTVLNLVHPYSLTTGILTVVMFAMHGALYINLKTEGPIRDKAVGWFWKAFFAFLALWAVVTVWTLVKVPTMIANFGDVWPMWGFAILTIMAIANIPRCVKKGLPFRAFVSSGCVIIGLVFLFGMGIYPNMIPSSIDPAYNLTIYNTASSQTTLAIGLLMVLIGIPFVASYTGAIYWVFRGRVSGEIEGAGY